MTSLTYKKIGLFLLLFMMFFAGCKRTITIQTILNNNGSLERIVSVSGDSTGVGKTAYPFPQDNSWNMMTHKDSANSYTYIIEKNFANVSLLNKEIMYREDSLQFDALATLDKKFRWFYSYYRYEETFFKIFPFTGANILDYVTQEQLDIYQAGYDSTDIEDKIEEYAAHSMFNEFYDAFVSAVENASLGMEKSTLDLKKDELFAKIGEWDLFEDEEDFGRYFLRIADVVYKPAQSFLTLQSVLHETAAKFNDYFNLIFQDRPAEEYCFKVQVPGRVIDTNANQGVNNREATWNFSDDQFNYADYVMWVESRRLNVVPTMLTALFILTGLFLLWLSARRTRREKLEAQGIAWQDRKRFILPWWLSILLIVGGIVLAGYFVWVYIIFNSHPAFLLLDIFVATPRDNFWFISLTAIGVLLALFGSVQLGLFFKKRKKSADLNTQDS